MAYEGMLVKALPSAGRLDESGDCPLSLQQLCSAKVFAVRIPGMKELHTRSGLLLKITDASHSMTLRSSMMVILEENRTHDACPEHQADTNLSTSQVSDCDA